MISPALSSSLKGRRPSRAFSLVELLVAIAILSVIVLVMGAISTQAGKAWLRGLGQNERRSNGRALLEFIARDLRNAALPPRLASPDSASIAPANLQFFANIITGLGTANPTAIPTTDMNPHAIFWQAPVAINTTYGTMAEIGYFVRWDQTSHPGTAIARMCRFLVNPTGIDPTTGNTAIASNFLIYNRDSNGKPVNWLSVVDAVAPATSPNYQGWFADNVIGFWVRCLDSANQPVTSNAAGVTFPNNGYGFDSRQGYTDSTGAIHSAPALPAAVDLAMVTVDAKTAAHITTPLLATVTNPSDLLKDKSTSGSIAYFVANLPPSVKPGAQIFFTTVYISSK